MPYGTIKVDTITFTAGGVDTNVSISGLVQNPTFSGNITTTGNITGANVIGTTTVSGATVTGNTGSFTTLTGGVTTITSGVFATGTQALPSISFTSDPNTGIYSPGADQVAISTNGTGRLFVDASGNVGVGSSSPDKWSDANVTQGTFKGALIGAVNIEGNRTTSSDVGRLAFWQATNRIAYIGAERAGADNSGALRFTTTNAGSESERMRLDSSGRLGVGTSSPSSALDVSGAISLGAVAIPSAGTARIFSRNTDSSLYIQTAGGNTVNLLDGSQNTLASFGSSTISLNTGNTPRLYIDSSGRVGLGTSSPSALFHVAQDSSDGTQARITGATNQNYQLRWGFDTTNLVGRIQSIHVGTAYRALSLNPDGGNVGIGTTGPLTICDVKPSTNRHIVFSASSTYANNAVVGVDDAGAEIALGIGGSPIQFITGLNERARIDSSGRLLVGTSTSPTVGDAQYGLLRTQGNTSTSSGFGLLSIARGLAPASITSGAEIGYIHFTANDGSPFARIECSADANAGANDYPGRLVFSTTADGSPGPTERMRITSAGNVGIGTTAPVGPLTIQGPAGTNGINQGIGFLYSNGTSYGALGLNNGTGWPQLMARAGSGLTFHVNSDLLTTGEAARIDSSGRLLVGTSSARNTFINQTYIPIVQIEGVSANNPNGLSIVTNTNDDNPAWIYLGKSRGTAVGSNTAVQNGDVLGGIAFAGANGTDMSNTAAWIRCSVDGTPFSSGDTTDLPGALVFSTTADGASSPTEAMRITSDARVLFGTTGTPSASVTGAAFTPQTNGRMSLFSSTSSTATQKHALFFNPNGEVGSISTNASATAYTTSSDYRLKENIIPLTGASERVLQLKPSRFNFIADPDIQVDGFIAHEAQAVVPECVIGAKDEVDEDGNPVYQGIDQSKLVPLLTAALQEALAEIESLKARLTAAGI